MITVKNPATHRETAHGNTTVSTATHIDSHPPGDKTRKKCPDCNKVYVGQTGRSFQIRFNEHKKVLQTNSHTSNYAKHLNEYTHPFGSSQNTMQTLQ